MFGEHIQAKASLNRREGIGSCEAPRGTLFHHYWVDADGLMPKANLLIATAQNNQAMNLAVEQTARRFVRAQAPLPRHGRDRRRHAESPGSGDPLLRSLPFLFDPRARADADRGGSAPRRWHAAWPSRTPAVSPAKPARKQATRVLLIACGNPLRRDDGVAHHVLDRMSAGMRMDCCQIETRACLQLTPELAEAIASCARVVFLDADLQAGAVSLERIEPLGADTSRARFSHSTSARDIVSLARELFDFRGEAFLCRIPVQDLSAGQGLSARGREGASDALPLLRQFLA